MKTCFKSSNIPKTNDLYITKKKVIINEKINETLPPLS